MSNFGLYAAYYDLLYSDKNYQAEADYIDRMISAHKTERPLKLLDLGCGTGKHDFCLAAKGYSVTGVDLSATMIEEAKRAGSANKVESDFIQGDVRSFRNGRK